MDDTRNDNADRVRREPIPDWIHALKNQKKTWAPGAWQHQPPMKPHVLLPPVIVGGESVFADAHAIRESYQLPAPPRTQRTTISESGCLPLALREDRANSPSVTICILSATHRYDLEYRPYGRDVNVWFEDRPRSCWYPTGFRRENTVAEGAHEQESELRSVEYTRMWQDEDGQWKESPVPLRVT